MLSTLIERTPARDQGAVAILVAIFAVVMFGFAAIIVDLGAARSTGNDAQNATDASVLAAANALYGDDAVTGPNFPAAVAAAKSYAQENYGTAPSEWASPGCTDPGHRDYMPGGTECISFDEEENPTTVRVRIPPRHVGSFFGGIVGYDGLTISTVAEASTEVVVSQECVVCVFDELRVEAAGQLNVTGGGSVHGGRLEMPTPPPHEPTPGKITVADDGEIAATVANPASGISMYDPNPPRTDLASVQDPLTVAAPPVDPSVPTPYTCDNAHPLTPGNYTTITVPGGQTCDMANGIYNISEKVDFLGSGGAGLVGDNVTLYFSCTDPSGCGEALMGTGTVTITGWDNTGGWNPGRVSILFRSDNDGHQHIGRGAVAIGGTVYAPGAEVHVRDAQTIVAHRVIVNRLQIGIDSELRVNVPVATIEPSGFGLSK